MPKLHEPISPARLAIELVSIVLGVLLAFAAEEWRVGREHDHLAVAALQSVQDEVSANQAVLEKRIPYHQALLDSVTTLERRLLQMTPAGPRLRPGARLRTPAEMGFTNGFALTSPAATAWQAVLATNVLGYLDYGAALAISQAYATQQELHDEISAFGADFPVIFAGIAGEGRPVTALITLEVHLGDLLTREREMLAQYKHLDQVIGKREAPRATATSAHTGT